MENNIEYGKNSSLAKEKWLNIEDLQPKELIYTEIIKERQKQDEKWKEQNHPIVNKEVKRNFISEQSAKDWCDAASQEKCLTWGHIIIEEIAEALNAPNKESMREELIQCAAVIVAMIESLDRNGK